MKDRNYIILPYPITVLGDISDYLKSLGLIPTKDYTITYESRLDEIRWWFNDEKYLTMIYLKFGGKL